MSFPHVRCNWRSFLCNTDGLELFNVVVGGERSPKQKLTVGLLGVLDREGNARKVVNCSCVVVRDWGEESQERSILLNYFQTEQ